MWALRRWPTAAPLWPVQNGPELRRRHRRGVQPPAAEAFAKISAPRGWTTTSPRRTRCSGSTRSTTAPTNTPTANPLSRVFEALREQVLACRRRTYSRRRASTRHVRLFPRRHYYFTGSTPVTCPAGFSGASGRRRGDRRRHGAQRRIADHPGRHQRRQQSDGGAQSVHLETTSSSGAAIIRSRSGCGCSAYRQRQPGAEPVRAGIFQQPGELSPGDHLDVHGRALPTPLGWRSIEGRRVRAGLHPRDARSSIVAGTPHRDPRTDGTRRTDARRITFSTPMA